MGSTFVEINANGFWVRDWNLELWLRLAALQILEPGSDRSDQERDITLEIRNQWLLASMGFFNGCVPDGIDQFSKSDIGRRVMQEACAKLLKRLLRCGPTLSKDMIYLLGIEGEPFGDQPTWKMIEMSQAIDDLLNGLPFGDPGAVGIPMPGSGDGPAYRQWRASTRTERM